MSSRSVRRAAFACAVCSALSLPALAQTPQSTDQQTAPDPASPATGWATQSTPGTGIRQPAPGEAQPPLVLSSEQISLVRGINDYLNNLSNLEGRFVQTDHRNERKKGRFYVQRPGRLRFDYSAPSKLRIVSDGEYLAIEDHDLKTVDKFPLEATPILLFLGENIDLLRDAVILQMHQDESAVAIVMVDKSGNAGGQLQLFFKRPELELYEWVVTDAQGLDTRIQLADLIAGNKKSKGFFQSSSIELDNIDNN
ncbi:MAG: outer-membrane lipoprotein carrier protein LolA [Hyphomicrobiaceae bacterium]|nr:outer-membrane lipoprotein carrier protein LolA [Hyphomicrobiaceae bacterium]